MIPFPPPTLKYDRDNEAQFRRQLETADAHNLKSQQAAVVAAVRSGQSATTGVLTATATTVYTFPAAEGAYLCWVSLPADAANYGAFAVVTTGTTNARIAVAGNAPLMVITLVGYALKAAQASGATQTVYTSVLKIA